MVSQVGKRKMFSLKGQHLKNDFEKRKPKYMYDGLGLLKKYGGFPSHSVVVC